MGATAASCDSLIAIWASWDEDYEAAVDDFISGPFSEERVNESLRVVIRDARSHRGTMY